MVGIAARTQRGVARAQQDQVAVQHARGIYLSAGHHVGGPGESVHRQQGKGGGGGGELGARCRDQQPALIEPVERLAVERGHADAELGVAQLRIGQNRLDTVGQRALGRNRSRMFRR
jgi:hypothetical protein